MLNHLRPPPTMTDPMNDLASINEPGSAAATAQSPPDAHSFLDLLSVEDRTALLERCTRRVLARRQLLFSRGEQRANVFILRTGRVKLVRQTHSGNEVITSLCGPGELVGFSGLSRASTRMASAQVVEAGEAFVLEDREFRQALAACPGIAIAVIESLRWRMEAVADSLTDVVSEDVPNRILRLLHRLAQGQGQQRTDGEWALDLRLTHQELANMIGARRQTVTTAINDLHRDGRLRRDQHRLVLATPLSARPATPGAGATARA